MSDIIKLLPDSVANQIAAGEVIQRPASVIKELVENAVDAGASDIRIYIKDAGRTLIQVVDNGCGMSPVDARMAFERHATSKIVRADDLFRLRTMGFRGEALPSICAISQVDIRTRRESDQMGTRLLINGSKVENQQPDMCEKGTSISVKNLFFNVPARRKFLKSDNVELSNVMREFERLALVNNGIRMSIDTGARQIDLRAASLHQRIHDIWKNNLKMQLLPVEVDTQLVKVHGFVSRPEFARRRNALQFLIVNGRNMRHPYFHKAIVSCFEGLIASDTQPCYFLKFEVDPASIDVNIHPTKNEIKFEYEHEIWPLLVAGVKASLGKNSAVPSIDFDSDAVPVSPQPQGTDPDSPGVEMPADYNPFDVQGDSDFGFPGVPGGGGIPSGFPADPEDFGTPSGFRTQDHAFHDHPGGGSRSGGAHFRQSDPALRDWDKLYAGFMNRQREELPEELPSDDAARLPGMDPEGIGELQPVCLQFGLKYIITSTRDGVLIIDQHRAHVKVLYEQFLERVKSEQSVAQSVLFPETIRLEHEQLTALAEVEPDLRRLGFILDEDKEGHWRISSVPADMHGADPKDVVLRILDSVSEDSLNYGADQLPADSMLQRVALIMARSAAITRGRRLSPEEMEHLVAELFQLPDPSFTPNGNRIFARLDLQSIARLLG
ncbi:MAG: DNA mismatch repair endonuclease MutL [Muribaculaceae bacterium]|nr:DNA mismatch repair endonuclease MutL [Muribaculaceae bacterium]